MPEAPICSDLFEDYRGRVFICEREPDHEGNHGIPRKKLVQGGRSYADLRRAGEATVGNYEAAPPVPPLTDEPTTGPLVPVDSGNCESAASSVGSSAASTVRGSVANGRDLGGVSPLPSFSSRPVGAPTAAAGGTSSPNTDALGCAPGTPVERAARSAQNGG